MKMCFIKMRLPKNCGFCPLAKVVPIQGDETKTGFKCVNGCIDVNNPHNKRPDHCPIKIELDFNDPGEEDGTYIQIHNSPEEKTIRCQDCKHWRVLKSSEFHGMCMNLELAAPTDARWFCADGEKKEDNDADL